jgi:hypothetical protein
MLPLVRLERLLGGDLDGMVWPGVNQVHGHLAAGPGKQVESP